jgi:hypothetical protein
MSENSTTHERYKRENDVIIIEVGVKNSRQLFNERDPAPFRERDLDDRFVSYLVSAVEEFPLRAKIKIRILTEDEADLKAENTLMIRDAFSSFFRYESKLAHSRLKKHRRTARFFFGIGLVTLVFCLTLSEFVTGMNIPPMISNILSVGLIIIGWVAMWRPIEALFYDWWPILEKRRTYEKMVSIDLEILKSVSQNQEV